MPITDENLYVFLNNARISLQPGVNGRTLLRWLQNEQISPQQYNEALSYLRPIAEEEDGIELLLQTDRTGQPETMHIFTCSHCHRQASIRVGITVIGSATGWMSAKHMAEMDEPTIKRNVETEENPDDWNTTGEYNYYCDNCGREYSIEEIKGQIRTEILPPATSRTDTISVSGFSGDRIMLQSNRLRPVEKTQKLVPNEDRYSTLTGPDIKYRHKEEMLPEAFSPEVISPYKRQQDPYGYALTAECSKCHHSFMIGPEDANVTCPECHNEFDVTPLQKPFDPQNASERRRRFSPSFDPQQQ